MKKEKLYFKDKEDTFCTSLESRLEYAADEGLTEITLIEAIPDDGNHDIIWCTQYSECTEKSECKKHICPGYSSKSGRGKCEHKGNLYLHGEEVKFKVPDIC